MAGADYVIQAFKLAADRDLRNKQLAESGRQFDAQMGLNRDKFAWQQESTAEDQRLRELAIKNQGRRLDFAIESSNNLKERQKNLTQVKQQMLAEQDQREQYIQQNQQVMRQFDESLNSGRMVNLNDIAFGQNVDPEILNGARQNSGRGTGIYGQRGEDGRINLFTLDKETNEYLPFTANPEDNESAQLYLDGDNASGILYSLAATREEVEANDTDGSLMSRFAENNGFLVTGEDGRVTTRKRYKLEEQARREVEAQNKLIDQQNEKLRLKHEQEQAAEKGSMVAGRKGGAIDDVAAAIKHSPSSMLLGAHPLAKAAKGATSLGDSVDVAVKWAFGEKTDEAKKQEIAAKVKNKPPEMQERIVFSEYLKEEYGPMFRRSEREKLAKLRGGSIGALQATRAERRKVADLMIKADPDADMGAVQNYIKTGTYKSPAELRQMGIENTKQMLSIRKSEMEIRQMMAELGESGQGISPDQFLSKAQPMIDTATTANFYGDKKDLARVKAKNASRFAHFFASNGIQPQRSMVDLAFFDGVLQADGMLQSTFADQGFDLQSLGPAVAMALKFKDGSGSEEAKQEFATNLIGYAQQNSVSIDKAAAAFVSGEISF